MSRLFFIVIMKHLLSCLLWAVLGQLAYAQSTPAVPPVPPSPAENKKVTTDWRIEGQIGVSTNGQAIFLNFGGPNIRFQYKKVAWGVGMYPSLRFWEDKPRTFITPSLGFGAYLQYKKIGLIAPMYYNGAKNEWIPSVGLSYKLSK